MAPKPRAAGLLRVHFDDLCLDVEIVRGARIGEGHFRQRARKRRLVQRGGAVEDEVAGEHQRLPVAAHLVHRRAVASASERPCQCESSSSTHTCVAAKAAPSALRRNRENSATNSSFSINRTTSGARPRAASERASSSRHAAGEGGVNTVHP